MTKESIPFRFQGRGNPFHYQKEDKLVREFKEQVEEGTTPTTESLQQVISILNTYLKLRPPPPRPKGPGPEKARRRVETFFAVLSRVQQGMHRDKAIQEATETTKEYDQVCDWFEKGRLRLTPNGAIFSK